MRDGNSDVGAQLQAEFYRKTADKYESLYCSRPFLHDEALEYMAGMHIAGEFLDVGAGTGRGVAFLHEKGHKVTGVEPIAEMIAQCKYPELIREGSGYALPFADASFECVFELGVLHHVAKPAQMLAEMCRVSSRFVVISDMNRFGRGSWLGRRVKWLLWKMGLWPLANWLKTRGKKWVFCESDGIHYSYSVYDDLRALKQWGRIVAINVPGHRSAATVLEGLDVMVVLEKH